MSTVGERIKRARLARKMSGEELALAVGYKNQSAIGNLENRAAGKGGNKLPEIARQLRVPLNWLLEGPDGPTVPSSEPLEVYPPPAESANLAQQSSATYVVDASLREGYELFKSLNTEQRLAAIEHMQRLVTGRPSSTNHPSPGGADPLPQPKAA